MLHLFHNVYQRTCIAQKGKKAQLSWGVRRIYRLKIWELNDGPYISISTVGNILFHILHDTTGMKYVVNSVCFTGNFQKPLISPIYFVFSVNIGLFRVSVMRWRSQATSSSGKKNLTCLSVCTLPSSPWDFHICVIAFSHREILTKLRNLQMQAFAAECFPPLLAGALLALPQLCEWLCSIIWTKCDCPGKNTCLSCPPAGMSLVMLQGITAFFSHGQSCAPCISAGAMGWAKWWTGRRRRILDHLHKKIYSHYIWIC